MDIITYSQSCPAEDLQIHRSLSSANNDADSSMPLLFATIGNPTISFKKITAMDKLNRTEFSLEHEFRK